MFLLICSINDYISYKHANLRKVLVVIIYFIISIFFNFPNFEHKYQYKVVDLQMARKILWWILVVPIVQLVTRCYISAWSWQ